MEGLGAVLITGVVAASRIIRDSERVGARRRLDVLGAGPETGLIHLFQRNLEREAEGEDDLAEQIRITILHETAHYFGADEQDMHRFGLN